MDIGRMSMNMSNSSLKSAVNLSLMKMQMNSNETMANGMQEILQKSVVDPSKGNVIDKRA